MYSIKGIVMIFLIDAIGEIFFYYTFIYYIV